MGCSNDFVVDNVPVWCVADNVVEFLETYSNWTIVLLNSWFVSDDVTEVSSADLFEGLSQVSVDKGFDKILAELFSQKNVASDQFELLGYHVDSHDGGSFVDTSFVVALSPGGLDVLSDVASDPVPFTKNVSVSFNMYDAPHVSDFSKIMPDCIVDVLEDSVEHATEYGFVDLVDSWEHVWLHDMILLLNSQHYLERLALCLTVDPFWFAGVANTLALGVSNAGASSVYHNWISRMASDTLKVSSKDVSSDTNMMRLTASALIRSVSFKDLYDSVYAVLS